EGEVRGAVVGLVEDVEVAPPQADAAEAIRAAAAADAANQVRPADAALRVDAVLAADAAPATHAVGALGAIRRRGAVLAAREPLRLDAEGASVAAAEIGRASCRERV